MKPKLVALAIVVLVVVIANVLTIALIPAIYMQSNNLVSAPSTKVVVVASRSGGLSGVLQFKVLTSGTISTSSGSISVSSGATVAIEFASSSGTLWIGSDGYMSASGVAVNAIYVNGNKVSGSTTITGVNNVRVDLSSLMTSLTLTITGSGWTQITYGGQTLVSGSNSQTIVIPNIAATSSQALNLNLGTNSIYLEATSNQPQIGVTTTSPITTTAPPTTTVVVTTTPRTTTTTISPATYSTFVTVLSGVVSVPVTASAVFTITSPVTATVTAVTTTTVPITIATTATLTIPITTTPKTTTTIVTITPVTTTTSPITSITTTTTIPRTTTTTVVSTERIFQFSFPWNDYSKTVIDLSGYLDKPAGKYGPVTVGSDGHLYVGGKRIRFVGVSVVSTGAFPSKDIADIIVARLAKYGINLVRFHAIDAYWDSNNNIFSPPGTRQLNSANLDRMDYFVARLKEHGIYIDINLMCYRKFSSADGLPSAVDSMQVKDQHLLPFFYDPARQLVKEFARQLLTHVNPYTGLSYADDPAVAFIEILNEYGMTFGWFDGAVDRLPDVFKSVLRDKWNTFLINKYGNTANLAKAWGSSLLPGESLESRTVDIFYVSDYTSRRPTLQARLDWAEFLWRLDYDYFMDMYSFLKNELKVKAIVIGTQSAWGGLPNVMAHLDAVDSHHYWRYPEGSGSNWYVVNDPMVNSPGSNTMSQLAFRSIYGKPFTVSEYNHPAPNMYRAEGFAFLPAFASFQDWDAIMPYNYGPWYQTAPGWDSGRMRGTLDFDQDPVRWALMLTSYFLFVRGDVSPAKQVVVAQMTKAKELDLVANKVAGVWNLPNAGQLNVPYYVPLIHGFRMVVDNTTSPTDALSPDKVAPPTDNVIRSDTGELVWDCSVSNRCVFIVNTSRSIVLTGYVGGRRFDFGVVSIEVGDTLLDGWATIALHVLDGNSFQDAKRILVIAIGTGFNYNMPIYNYDNRQLLFRASTNLTKAQLAGLYGMRITTFDDWGSAPTIVEGIDATITIRTSKSVSAWSLNNLGAEASQVSVDSVGNGWRVTLSPAYKTLLYEVLVS